jgi:hypothetical protein
MYTTGVIQSLQAFGYITYTDRNYNVHLYMAHFPLLLLPLANSPLSPLLLTWNPPSCDRNRPPRSQVACKLTPFAPPFTQLFPPSPDSQKPNCPAPYYNDLGNIPDPLYETVSVAKMANDYKFLCASVYFILV